MRQGAGRIVRRSDDTAGDPGRHTCRHLGRHPGRHPPANAEPTRSRRPWRCGRSRRCEGTGRLAHTLARLAATGVVRRLAECAVKVGPTSTGEVDQHRVVANASWAAAKLSERVVSGGGGERRRACDDPTRDGLGALTRSRRACCDGSHPPRLKPDRRSSSSRRAPPRSSSPRSVPRCSTRRASGGQGDGVPSDDDVAAMTILTHRGLRSCFARGREEMEKEARGTRDGRPRTAHTTSFVSIRKVSRNPRRTTSPRFATPRRRSAASASSSTRDTFGRRWLRRARGDRPRWVGAPRGGWSTASSRCSASAPSRRP